jgi:putative nucleotidyltransferase with HDIG domain
MPAREDAWNLLCEYTESDSLRRHGLAVEQVMRKMAQKYGEDEELWAMTGLLHDFDYEKYPTMEEHPFVGNKILKENGYPEELTTAIMGHANYTGVPRESLMAKALYAVDEISGFMFAVTYCSTVKINSRCEGKIGKEKAKTEKFRSFRESGRGVRRAGRAGCYTGRTHPVHY